MATVPTLAQIKDHLYLEHDDDDSLIDMYLDAAKEKLTAETGINLNTAESNLANMYLKMQVALWYEQRLPVSKDSLNAVPHSLDSILRLIRLSVKDGDTSPC